MQVGGIYIWLFLKDPEFPLWNPKRFLEGLLDQYLSSIAATHYETNYWSIVAFASLCYISFFSPCASCTSRSCGISWVCAQTCCSCGLWGAGWKQWCHQLSQIMTIMQTEWMREPTQTPQERVRLSCLRVLHQLAASTTGIWQLVKLNFFLLSVKQTKPWYYPSERIAPMFGWWHTI